MINKDDFDEGKAKEIITSRATPVKSNALAKKNHSTIKKSQLRSPFGSNIFQDISNTQGGCYSVANQSSLVLNRG